MTTTVETEVSVRGNITVPADAFARACANIGHFIPSKTIGAFGPEALLCFDYGFLTLTGTDGIILGRETHLGPTQGSARVTLLPDSLDLLDRACRGLRQAPMRIDIEGDTLSLTDPEGTLTTVPVMHVEPGSPSDAVWNAAESILIRQQLRQRNLPPVVCMDQARLAKLCRVKPDTGDRRMDIAFSDVHEPVLVKIGATFVGMIMPIKRDRHESAVGPEGLWNE